MNTLIRSTTLAALATLTMAGPAAAQDAFDVWPALDAVGSMHALDAGAAREDGIYTIVSALDPMDGFTSRLALAHGGTLTLDEAFDGACSPTTVVELHAWDPDLGLWMHLETAEDIGDGCTAFSASVGPGHYALRVIGVPDAHLVLATTADLALGETLSGGFGEQSGDRFQWYGAGGDEFGAADGTVTLCTDDGAGGCPGDTIITAVADDGTRLMDDDGGVALCSCLTLDATRDWQIDVSGYGEQAVDAYTLSVR